MDLISTSWSCARCGAAYISTPPEHGLCDQCLADLEALARLAPIAAQPCPACDGPVCADCGKALILLVPGGMAITDHAGEVSGDGELMRSRSPRCRSGSRSISGRMSWATGSRSPWPSGTC